MKKYYTMLSLLFVLWKFEHDVEDILEYQIDGTGIWQYVPGPYSLTDDKQDYKIPYESTGGNMVWFRVRRDWGEPLVPEDERPPRL